jgi:hypothetical protein
MQKEKKFYWVKIDDEWTVAELCDIKYDEWRIVGHGNFVSVKNFEEVGERILCPHI